MTGSTDNTALLWDLETGKQLRRFVGHSDAVSAVAFSKDGTQVLTASYDKTARLWETATGRQTRVFVENRQGVLIGHSDKILTAAFSADGRLVATAGEDKTARIWDAKTGTQLYLLEHDGRVNSIAFSPDSKYLLTGGEDKIARLYSSANGKEERQFVGHTGEITSVAYSPDGKQILTGSKDKTAQLWEKDTQLSANKFTMRNEILVVSFVQNQSEIILSDQDSTEIKDKNSGKLIWGITQSAISLAFTLNQKLIIVAKPDNKRFFAIGEDPQKTFSGIAYIFDVLDQLLKIKKNNDENSSDADLLREIERLNNSSNVSYLFGKSAEVHNIDTVENNPFILMGGNSPRSSSLWSLKSGQYNQLDSLTVRTDGIFPTFSSEGKIFVFRQGDEIQFLDTKTLAKVNSFVGYVDIPKKDFNQIKVNKVCFLPSDKQFLIAIDNKVYQTDLSSFQGNKVYEGHQGKVYEIIVSKDGKTIATASEDKTIRLWNAETGEVKQIIKGFTAPVLSVAFSPDGKTIATASGGEIDMLNVGIGNAVDANGVQLWDVATGEKIEGGFGGEFKSFTNKFTGFKSVAYSPDKEGRYIVAGSFDGKVYVRDNQTKELKKFEGHTGSVNSVKFAKDANGKLLVVSGSSDSTTRIWDAATGEEICALVTFRDGNWAVVQTRTGRYDAPNGGEIDGINWVFGTETIALNQLKDIYYTPNLLPRLLGYNNDPLRPVPELAKLKLFPKILEQKLDEKNARLTVKLQNRGGGIGEVLVKINGKLAAPDARSEKQKADWNAAEMTIDFNLQGSAGFDPNAKNKIEVITNNYDPAIKKGYISSKGTEIVYLGDRADELPKPTFYAVVAGVSDYVGNEIDLNFAAKDAEDFAHALGIGARRLFCPQENQTCADKVKIKLLTTNEKDRSKYPTKENIKAAFAEIAKEAKPEDVLVVYLSGHGASLTLNDTDTYFYLAQDADKASKEALRNPEYRQAAAISSDELLDWLTQTEWRTGKKGIDANKQVMILDTCAAGAFEGKFTAANKTKDLSADQIRALERLKDRSGFQILMGSAANQSSYEASQYGQGLLTYALLEGIKGAALQNQTSVETGKLFNYAVERVPKMDIAGGASGLQQPRVFGATSIPIGLMLTSEDKAAIKILESPLPIFGRPFIFKNEENFDTLGLIGAFAKTLDEAGNPTSRGTGGNGQNASLVYVDEDNLPGAYRVTGTYTEDNGLITIEAVLRKDGKIIAPLEKVSGKDANEVTKLLLANVLKKLN